MVGRRGSALLMALLVGTMLFVAGMALAFQYRADYQNWTFSSRWGQARALAEAGLEDFRAKLERDPDFPPYLDIRQTVFEYWQAVPPQGGYQVRADISLRKEPWQLILVRSQGTLESGLTVSLEGEFDVSTSVRGNPALVNPHSYRFRLLPREVLSQ